MSGFGGSGFGGQQQPPSFGGGSGGFGGGSSGFGNPNPNNNSNPPFGSSTTPAPPSSGMSFGSSPNVMASSGGFGSSQPQQSSSSFGGGSGFGGNQPQSSFGNNSSSFGGNNNNNSSSSGFGANSGSFGQTSAPSSSTTTLNANANPFVPGQGVATAPSTMTFGTSSNVVTSGGNGGFGGAAPSSWGSSTLSGFGQNNVQGSSGFGSAGGTASSGFGSGGTSSSGFGGTASGFGGTSSTFGFGGGSSSSGFGGGSGSSPGFGGRDTAPSSGFGGGGGTNNHPFGGARFSAPQAQGSGGPSDDDDNMGDGGGSFRKDRRSGFSQQQQGNDVSFGRGGRPPKQSSSRMSTVQEEDDDEQASAAKEAQLKAKIEEKKRLLQAKLEEKKRRLAEKQQQQQQQRKSEDGSRTPTPTRDDMNKSLAERNAQRFRQDNQQNAASKHMLPEDTRHGQQQQQSSSSAPTAESGRADLDQAVALVGLCPYMCPDEELIRRQQENDIQALEIPMPGKLHPEGWTLRDTAVKRFRRSAADYKLDVPEWVRPPDVLERTISYIEEYIMERDRQGPDPRFPNGGTPPPLDIYQWIWDRTRMIRKDFILQNYVGTGGLCDARAVRCHERIARWHAMCEHQLSHIPDFISMQSQQNIQELGQTMKTLNQFYDDSLNRSTIEVPDDHGIETRVAADLPKYNQGCLSEIVEGKDPVDYDGSTLNNSSDDPSKTLRLIGKDVIDLPAHGTAEPEMRALYILLTMDNEGGMEVLKYAAKLFKERPAVYQSAPVQRAMEIFKSKKDFNYVRFFSFLRSPSTPYLFCCILFKHVELMRKIAFRIMSRTYGAQNKETGETVYDLYPLDRLVKLLCFEDITEAREACKFYNITVKQRQSPSGEIREIIYWRVTKFREPKHPEKGHTLRLQPRKMIRTIESKLNGATRLAVCRGQVSGEGAALSAPVVPSGSDIEAASLFPFNGDTEALASARSMSSDEEAHAKAQALLLKQRMERDRLEKQMKEKEESQRLQAEKAAQLQAEEDARQKAAKVEAARQAAEERSRAEARAKAEAEERQRQEKIEAEKARRAVEEAARKKAEEERIRQQEEAARKQRELEEQRKREEEARKEQERQRLIAEDQRKKALEEERLRQEEEARRREAERIELERRQKEEAEERRKAQQWQDKIDAANKLVLWKRWRRALARPLAMSIGSRATLQGIDSVAIDDRIDLGMLSSRREYHVRSHLGRPSTRGVIEQLLQHPSSKPSLASMTLKEFASSTIATTEQRHFNSAKSIFLFKVAVVIPETEEAADQGYASLLYQWINSCIDFGAIDTASSAVQAHYNQCEVRSVVVRGLTYEACQTADVALVIVPPMWSDPEQKLAMLGDMVSQLLDDDIPRVALVFSDQDGENITADEEDLVATALQSDLEGVSVLRPARLSTRAFTTAFEFCLKRASTIFVHQRCLQVSRISSMDIAAQAIMSVLWKCLPASSLPEDEDTIIKCSRIALDTMIQELDWRHQQNNAAWMLWPPPEFAAGSNIGVVESYFSPGAELPLGWGSLLTQKRLQDEFVDLMNAFRGHFGDVFQRILMNAPIVVKDDCASYCARGHYRQCLQKSLAWQQDFSSSSGPFLYLPEGLLEAVIDSVVEKSKTKVPAPPVFMDDVSVVSLEEKVEQAFIPIDTALGDTVPTDAIDIDDSLDVSNNKRRRSSSGLDDAEQETETDVLQREKRRKEEPLFNELKESDEFTKKLERMLRGEETVDVPVGDTSLSRLLRGVPRVDI